VNRLRRRIGPNNRESSESVRAGRMRFDPRVSRSPCALRVAKTQLRRSEKRSGPIGTIRSRLIVGARC